MPYIDSTSRQWAAASKAENAPRRIRAYKHDSGDLSVMDWFAGCGGSGQGADAVPGLRVAYAANHWKQAIETHQLNFPDVAHYIGDIRKAPVWAWPVTEIFWASPECFPAGTMILTRRGQVPIEDVRVGDEVFTHERRWRPVKVTMRKLAETVRVKGVGLAGGIETTAEHPFYTRQRTKVWQDRKHGYRWQLTGSPEWTEAKNLEGRMWATPTDFGEALPIPEIGGRGGIEFTPEFWWLIGRWLGDGSLHYSEKPRGERSRAEVIVTCGHHEADDLAPRIEAVEGLRWYRRNMRTAAAFGTGHRGLVQWLIEHFGQHSFGKTIPAWVLTMPEGDRRALLDGYLSTDGHEGGAYTQMDTISKRLALGLRMLANSLGHVANLSGPRTRKPTTIEGRPIVARPIWHMNWITAGPSKAFHVDADGYRWAPVKSVEPTGRTVEVFNLSVAEDESYLADGIMSHNCTQWSIAQGKKRSWAKAVQGDLLSLYADQEEEEAKFRTGAEGDAPTAEEEASRALMEEVPLYLRGVIERGGLVKAGVVENVTDVRAWSEWDAWLGEFHKLGYRTRVIALNSMHADPRSVHKAPQSRDRLYVAYWHKSLGRTPDWDKWLRPRAYCPGCDEVVSALQVFRRPGQDMGRYGSSYDYRCPRKSCRKVVHPDVLPAAAAIDWTLKGTPIGSRKKTEDCPEGLAPNTMARIRAGIAKFWPQPGAQGEAQEVLFTEKAGGEAAPFTVPTGGTWRNGPAGVDVPMSTRTTVESDALVCPPILIPCEGREGKKPMPLDAPLRTQTARLETALAYAPVVIPMRGGGDLEKARHISSPLHTVSAGGNHHGLVTAPAPLVMRNNTPNGDPAQMVTPAGEPLRTMTATGSQSLIEADPLLVPYYGSGQARPASEPVGALPTRDRYALLDANGEYDVSKVLFRMLQPKEIQRAMAFGDDYKLLGSKRAVIRQLGNAVTPNAAEVLLCALVECITGEPIDRYAMAA